jgi:FkbM family methyltransferase
MHPLLRKIRTAGRVWSREGARGVARELRRNVWEWRRQGEWWELRKSPYIKLGGCRFTVDSIDDMSRWLLLDGSFEEEERALVRRFLEPSFAVIELGGNIGVVACTTNRLLADPSKHVVVEPNPRVIPILAANKALNRCGFQIVERIVAYGGDSATLFLDDNPQRSSLSGLSGTEAVEVKAVTLQAIQEQFGFDRFMLICDIEGGEFEMVEREAELMAAKAPVVVMEIHPDLGGPGSEERLQKRMESVGYRIAAADRQTRAFVRER